MLMFWLINLCKTIYQTMKVYFLENSINLYFLRKKFQHVNILSPHPYISLSLSTHTHTFYTHSVLFSNRWWEMIFPFYTHPFLSIIFFLSFSNTAKTSFYSCNSCRRNSHWRFIIVNLDVPLAKLAQPIFICQRRLVLGSVLWQCHLPMYKCSLFYPFLSYALKQK